MEADFEKVSGVIEVQGFSGDSIKNPTDKEVVKGGIGYKEAIEIEFVKQKIPIDKLLFTFLRSVNFVRSFRPSLRS